MVCEIFMTIDTTLTEENLSTTTVDVYLHVTLPTKIKKPLRSAVFNIK